MQSAWTALLTCQREFKYPASRRRETQTAAGPYFARAVTFLVSDSTRRGRRCRHTYLRASGCAGTEPALSLSAVAGARSSGAGRRRALSGAGGAAGSPPAGRGPPRAPSAPSADRPGPVPPLRGWSRASGGGSRRRSEAAAAAEPGRAPRGEAAAKAAAFPAGPARPYSPSRAVPMSWSSRARICAWADMAGPVRRRRLRPGLGTGAWGGGDGSAASAAATHGQR